MDATNISMERIRMQAMKKMHTELDRQYDRIIIGLDMMYYSTVQLITILNSTKENKIYGCIISNISKHSSYY